jgi:hypothetical protein
MDEIVLRGMAKWPNVPAVYGWLALDRRGGWRIKGERIANPLVSEFIGRNYACDERGRWFFQNGPQRVFVALDYAPFVFRIAGPADAPLALEAHTGSRVSAVTGAWLDETGTLLLATDLGVGTIHDRDLERLLPALTDARGSALPEGELDELMTLAQQGRAVSLWLRFRDASIRIGSIQSAAAPERFGYVLRPVQPAGQEECT